MHTTETELQFIELRAKGWSLARIANQIKVSQRTLVGWNRIRSTEIQAARLLVLEGLRDKILGSAEEEVARLNEMLVRFETELQGRKTRFIPTAALFRLAASLRSEIRKITDVPLQPEPTPTEPVPPQVSNTDIP